MMDATIQCRRSIVPEDQWPCHCVAVIASHYCKYVPNRQVGPPTCHEQMSQVIINLRPGKELVSVIVIS